MNYDSCGDMETDRFLGVVLPFSIPMLKVMGDYSGIGGTDADIEHSYDPEIVGVYDAHCTFGTDVCHILALGFQTLCKLYPEKYTIDLKNLPFHPYSLELENFDIVRLPNIILPL